MSQWSFISDVDLPFDTENETFEGMLERLAKEVPSAHVQVWRAVGSGGGWPQGNAIVKTSDLTSFFEFFGYDSSDYEIFIEDVVSLDAV